MIVGKIYRAVAGGERSSVRGQSELIGMILLIGMVFTSVVLVVASGWVLLDDLEGDVRAGHVERTLDVTNDQITNVAASGRSKQLSTETLDGGQMRVARNTTEIELSTAHGGCGGSYSFTLSALVYETVERTWVLEGGGKWVIGPNGHPRAGTAPNLRYENGQLSINLFTLQDNARRGDRMVAKHSGDSAVNRSKLLDVLRCPGGSGHHNTVRMNVTSEYAGAWNQHLSRAVNGSNVIHHGPTHEDTADDEVRIVIDELVEQRHPEFTLDGIDPDDSSIATFDDGLEVSPRVSNEGTASGAATVTLSINPEWNRTTGALDPGGSTEVTYDLDEDELRTIDGVDPGKAEQDLWQYGRYEYNVTAGDARGTSAFFLSYDDPFYRLEGVSHTETPETVTVATDFTNIGDESAEHELTFSLQGESEDGSIDVDRERTVDIETAPWNRSTFTIDLNRSRLPYGTYEYTVDVSDNYDSSICTRNSDACTRTGQFTLSKDNDGAGISNVSSVRVEEPSDVSVKVIGTEISGEGDTGSAMRRNLDTITATAIVGDKRIRFSPEGTHTVDDPHEGDIMKHNLNTYGTQETVWNYSTQLEAGESLRIEATWWKCDRWEFVTRDTHDGTTYKNYECADINESDYVQVTLAGDGGSEGGTGFAMTRDSSRNDLPPIAVSSPRQRNATEIFTDGTDDITVRNGDLTLDDNEVAFMMEATQDHSTIQQHYPDYADGWSDVDTSNQTAMSRAAWDLAQDGSDDPDFNDVIGLVDVEPNGYISLDDPFSDPSVEESRITTNSEVQDGTDPDDADGIRVRVDEVIIR